MAGKPKPRQVVDVQVIEKREDLPATAREGELFIRITPKDGPLSTREVGEIATGAKDVLKKQGHTVARGRAAEQART